VDADHEAISESDNFKKLRKLKFTSVIGQGVVLEDPEEMTRQRVKEPSDDAHNTHRNDLKCTNQRVLEDMNAEETNDLDF